MNIEEIFKSRIFNHRKKPKEMNIFYVDEIPIGSLGNYVVFSGLPKSGKSTYLAGVVASAYTPYHIFRMKIVRPENKKTILYVDTESGDPEQYTQTEKIRKFIDRKSLPDDITVINCRQDDPKMIIALVEHFIKTNSDCGIIIIDGLLDVAYNYNDVIESKNLVNWLKRITKEANIFIITIIHTSKSNNSTLGHLGAIADRAAQTVLEIRKEKRLKPAQFVCTPTYLRSSDEFEPIAICCINNNWQLCEYIEPEETPIKKKK